MFSPRQALALVAGGWVHHGIGDVTAAVCADVPGGSALVVGGGADDHRGGGTVQGPVRWGRDRGAHRGTDCGACDHGRAVGVLGAAVIVVVVVIVGVVLPVLAPVRTVILPILPRLVALLLPLLGVLLVLFATLLHALVTRALPVRPPLEGTARGR